MNLATDNTPHIGTATHPFNALDRYVLVRCRFCRHRWARIDWGCAPHRLACNAEFDEVAVINPVPAIVRS